MSVGDVDLCGKCENKKYPYLLKRKEQRKPATTTTTTTISTSTGGNVEEKRMPAPVSDDGATNVLKRAPEKLDGIIINELLCFITNKMDTMPIDTIIALCLSHYSDKDVEDGKQLLFDLCGTESGRLIKRQGSKKSEHNLKDMLKILSETEPADIPCFVARNLNDLPPVTCDDTDTVSILRELNKMKMEIATLTRAKLEGELEREKLSQDVHSIKLNMEARTSPQGNAPSQPPIKRVVNAAQVDTSYAQVASKSKPKMPSTMDKGPRSTPDGPIKVKCPPVTTEQDEDPNNSTAPGKEGSGFKTVTRRRRQKPCIIGTSVNKGLRVAKPPMKIFISRLAPDTTCQEVCTFVKEVFDTEVDCEALKTKHPGYASFVISAPFSSGEKLLRPSDWPDYALVKKYFYQDNA